MGQTLNISAYTTEATVMPQAAVIGDTVASIVESQEGDIEVTAVLRHGLRAQVQPDTVIEQDGIFILMGDPDALDRAIAATGLALHDPDEAQEAGDETGIIEAVVIAGSVLIGSSAGRLMLKKRLGIRLIAISREGGRLRNKPSGVKLLAGAILTLQGFLDAMPGQLNLLGLLPRAQRRLRPGRQRKGWLAIAILAGAMLAKATGPVPVAFAFFAGAGLVLATGALPAQDAYEAIEWPILIMLGALIPVSETLQTTGASDVLAVTLAYGGSSAAMGRGGAGPAHLHGRDAVSQQCRDREGHGSDRGGFRP